MWRWYKTFRFGFLNTTVSKSGVGWSVGIPGLRYGINASGKKYWSFGFGGLRVVKYLEGKKVQRQVGRAKQSSSINPSMPQTPNQKVLHNLKKSKRD